MTAPRTHNDTAIYEITYLALQMYAGAFDHFYPHHDAIMELLSLVRKTGKPMIRAEELGESTQLALRIAANLPVQLVKVHYDEDGAAFSIATSAIVIA